MLWNGKRKENIAKAASIIAATGLVAVAFTGCVGTSSAAPFAANKNAAENSVEDANLAGVYGNPAENLNIPADEEVELVKSRCVALSVKGRGHLEALKNCEIDKDASVIRIADITKKSSFAFYKDSGVESVNLKLGNSTDVVDGNIVTLPAGFTSKVTVEFVEPAPAPEPEPAPAAEEAPAAEDNSGSNSGYDGGSYTYTETYEYVEPAPTYVEPAPVYEEPAPAYVEPAPVYEEPAPVSSGVTPPPMTAAEWAAVDEIFNAYNDYRAANGLNRVVWSDVAANMAYNSARGCSQASSLIHRLGIPAELQGCYSDILMFTTWRIDGVDAVAKWHTSDGHRRMMKCPSATEAGVAVYFDGSRWYSVIVYNFSGCNQMLNG